MSNPLTGGVRHVGLTVTDLDTLNTLYRKLEAAECVGIEFAPEPLRGGPAMHMMCYGPGGIRI